MSITGSGPMKGVRILDLGSMIAGPVASTILADQGADVIKIEPTGVGDVMRYLGPSCGGVSALFQNANRGKRSLALNLKTEAAQRIVHKLVSSVDVVLHNFRSGVAERLGIDYPTLSALNPDLVYLWVTGFGSQGPMAKDAAYDSVIQAFSGVCQSQADLDTGEPVQYYQLFSDKLTALTGAQAISSALYARSQGCGGQRIDLSMVDAVVCFLWGDAAGTATFLEEGATPGMNLARNKLFEFRHGWGTLAPVTDQQFHAAFTAFGVDSSAAELLTVVDRGANPECLENAFADFRKAAREVHIDEAIARLKAADVPCARAMHLADLPQHEQCIANELFVETDHPQAGRLVEPRNPARFSRTASVVGAPCPTLGQHSDDILASLGYSQEAVAELRSAGVVS